MKKNEYATMATKEESYWWHLGRLRIIEAYIKKYTKGRSGLKILNVGCGTGGTVALLEKYGEVFNVDVSDEAIAFMKKHGYSNVLKIKGTKLPFPDKEFDLVVAFDVLEHINDDTTALKEWRRVMKNDGSIILTVPAYQWLWTAHDESLQHYRRHTVGSIKSRAQAAELKLGKHSYAFVFSLPMVASFRLVNKALRKEMNEETSYVEVPQTVNKLFTKMLGVEATFHRFMRFPAGTSVIATLQNSQKSLVTTQKPTKAN